MENTKVTSYCINNIVDFIPDKNRLINCESRDENTLYSTASRCLFLLITNVGKVVSHKSLYEAGWESQGKEVTPNTLYQTISELRKQLKNAGFKQNIIQTLPRQGWTINNDVKVTEVTESVLLEETLAMSAIPDNGIKKLCKNLVKFLTQ
ncbi:winged helix-turn-helix domain-containing protein [Erwinia mallotivora]|uniref:winged helix-turn-helix domain-containing protein n=1 Tax=Erwinia mallotivora TaxID=69222 RepID=UPI0021C19B38|nr:winged helix-turn-helix domain-containing protein [Erwinia mallotivora]